MNFRKGIIRINVILLTICIVFSVLTGCKSTYVNNENEEIEAKVNEYIKAFNGVCTNNKYIGNILIGKGDKIVYQESFGNEYLVDSSQLHNDAVFKIGSITKTFTAVAILQLHERGLLNIDEPISKYIPLKDKDNKITIKSILNHTSGLVRDGYLDLTKRYSNENPLILSKESEPFTKWMYSNYGYKLLAYIIEIVSGTSYENFLQENIFKPINMDNTGCESPSSYISNMALPFKLHDGKITPGSKVNLCELAGCGNIYSTTSDLFKFIIALENEKLLNRDSLDMMTKDSTELSANYGFGMELGDFKGHEWFGHGGAITYGYRSMLIRFPDEDITVILLLNVYLENIIDMMFPLASIIMDENYYLPVEGNEILMSEEELALYEGEYKGPDNLIITIKNVGNNHLELTPSGLKAILIPYSKTDFAIKQVEYYKIQFLFDDNNQVKGLIGYSNVDKIIEAEKIK